MRNLQRVCLYFCVVLLVSCGASLSYEGQKQESPEADDLVPRFSLSADQLSKSTFCGIQQPEEQDEFSVGYRYSLDLLNAELASIEGLVGWAHGIVARYGHYTFVKRDLSNPMKFEIFSLSARTPELMATLNSLNRHDRLKLHGKVLENGSPIRHILIEKIDIAERYQNPSHTEYQINPELFSGLTKTKVFGKVHATVFAEKYGYGMILEHKDFILPIEVGFESKRILEEIYRNDIIEIAVNVIPGKQGRPTHFVIDSEVEEPIKIIDKIVNCNKIAKNLEGHLVKFYQSPSIRLDIYALRVVDANGIGRNFTFFPGNDLNEDPDGFMEVFGQLSEKAKNAWDRSEFSFTPARNFVENKKIRVRANGIMNVASKNQANPQIYLMSSDDLEILD